MCWLANNPSLSSTLMPLCMTQAFIGTNYVRNIFTGEIDTFVESRRAETSTPIELLNCAYRFNPNLESHWFGSVMGDHQQHQPIGYHSAGARPSSASVSTAHWEHLLVMP